MANQGVSCIFAEAQQDVPVPELVTGKYAKYWHLGNRVAVNYCPILSHHAPGICGIPPKKIMAKDIYRSHDSRIEEISAF